MHERFRCFLAVDVGEEIRREMARAKRRLERAGGDVRWTRPEGVHATLKFLGDVEPTRVPSVVAAARAVSDSRRAFSLRACGIGGFPTLEHPRVLWVGLEARSLAELAADLDAALVGCGFAAEEKPFRAHLTLGRVRSRRGWPALREALAEWQARDFGTVVVDDIVLYRSHLQPGGSVYEELARLPLVGAGEKQEGEADGHRQ